MKRHRDWIVTNAAALLVLAVALLAGWQEAAAFGLAVLIVMDLMALFRERSTRSHRASKK
jgi:hypothetical protein